MKQKTLDQIPTTLSTIAYAQALQQKAADLGFEWKDTAGLLSKLEEEIEELQEALKSGNIANIEEELGDVFFVLVNFARMTGISAETALKKGNEKFKRRFSGMEEDIASQNQTIKSLTLEELTCIWNKQKKKGL